MAFFSHRFRNRRRAMGRLPAPVIVVSLRFQARFCLLVMSCAATLAATAAAPVTFDDPTPTDRDHFGGSVSLDGDRVLIGASRDGTFGATYGQAYLFDLSSNLLRTFDDPTPVTHERFGSSVVLEGNDALISSQGQTFSSGEAHLFNAANGNWQRTFTNPSGAGPDRLVSLQIDGNTLVIGDPADDTLGFNVGQLHLFHAQTGNLIRTFNDPTPTYQDRFGEDAVIQGNNIIIGDRGDETFAESSGQAHLFDVTTGNLLLTFENPEPSGSDSFGISVDVDGPNIVIGKPNDDTLETDAGQVHLLNFDGDILHTYNNPFPDGGDIFGRHVKINGNHVLVSAPRDDTLGTDVGQVYLFHVTGNLLATFDDPTPTDRDHFGGSVSLEGNRVLIGAAKDDSMGENVGQAHLFTFLGPELGDYSYDGEVGGPDYTVWANTFGETGPGLAADGNGDEMIGPQDYTLWANNFGMGSGDGPQAVPEPSAFLLTALGVVGLILGARRRAIESLTEPRLSADDADSRRWMF